MKPVDLSLTVYELCRAHPGIADVLAGLGFTDIVKPGMLQTAGRFITLPKGAQMRHIDLETVKQALRENGYDPG